MLESVLVAIDSFDSSNKDVVKPKDRINAVNRGRFSNRGPMKEKNQDKRFTIDPNWYIYNGECEDVQILLVSSQLPQRLLCTASNRDEDYALDANGKSVDENMAKRRRRGYFKRKDIVGQRTSNKIDIIWVSTKSRRRFQLEPESLLYTDGTDASRIELSINDTYKDTTFDRPLYLPAGVNAGDIHYNTFANATRRDDVKRMFAVGCTCRDMLFRGAVEARYGCKHMIAWEKARAKDDGSLWN